LYYDYCEVCFNKVKAIVEKWDGEMDSDEFEESLENEEDSDEE
jgi:copper chaperone CopZ